MKILLDEDLPLQFVGLIRPHHDASHVAEIGWQGKSNGDLLRDAAAAGFDVVVTGDSHMQYQQDLSTFAIAVIELRPRRIVLSALAELIPELLTTIAGARKGEAVTIPTARKIDEPGSTE